MSYKSTIIVVDDVIKSRTLYENILGCKVEADFGIYNVGFAGGLALYKKSLFQDLTGNIPIHSKANTCVLYFEFDDLDGVEEVIRAHGFEFVHPIREQPWGQRTFRFYDYDGHMLETAEVMSAAILRMVNEHKSIEEIAQKTGYTEDQVKQELKAARIVKSP